MAWLYFALPDAETLARLALEVDEQVRMRAGARRRPRLGGVLINPIRSVPG
jgi:hypothetical protein